MELSTIVSKGLSAYDDSTATRLKILDVFLVFAALTGAVQFAYCMAVGTFPFNSFLSGFISCVGSFVLGVCLRIQVTTGLKFSWIWPQTGATRAPARPPEPRTAPEFVLGRGARVGAAALPRASRLLKIFHGHLHGNLTPVLMHQNRHSE